MSDQFPVIAVLGGTGREGRGLALRWAARGHKILIGSRSLEKATITKKELNLHLEKDMVEGFLNSDAAMKADICVLTVTHSAHEQVLSDLRHVLQNKILIDATSRVDYRDPKPPAPPSAPQRAQTILGESVRVVAAFQNIPAKMLSKRIGESIDADVLVCSDDLEAAKMVIQLAVTAGMHGYYAGKLENSNIIEGLTSILLVMNKHYGVKDASIKITGIIDSGLSL